MLSLLLWNETWLVKLLYIINYVIYKWDCVLNVPSQNLFKIPLKENLELFRKDDKFNRQFDILYSDQTSHSGGSVN